MSELITFNKKEFGEIRTMEIDGKFYAVGVDVARILEYSNPSKAVSDHCKGDFLTWEVIDGLGRKQKTRMIPEGDIYRLAVKASEQRKNDKIKAKAEAFEHWIFDEILPSIRKKGKYEYPKPYATKATSLGEVASYTKEMDKRMENQGSRPYEIAAAFKLVSEQFGIILPDDFVKIPTYEQVGFLE